MKNNTNVAEAMKYGPLNERIKSASSELCLEKDFIKLNRVGIKKGVTTARDQKQVLINFKFEKKLSEQRRWWEDLSRYGNEFVSIHFVIYAIRFEPKSFIFRRIVCLKCTD